MPKLTRKKPVCQIALPDDPATAYAVSVAQGRVPAGALMRGACQRHIADLARVDDPGYAYSFNPGAGEKFAKFCLMLRHYKGEHAGKPVILEPVQRFIFGVLLGWNHKADGLRRFRTAYIELPRKNGKSAILSCLSLYMLAMDGEPGADCYTLATKRDQAKIVWGDAVKMLPTEMKEKWFLHRTNKLEFPRTNSTLQPLASEYNTLDGLNPHFACADELHEWPDRALWDVIQDGMGSRRQPLLIAITTAGSNLQSFCYTLRKAAVSLSEDAGRGGFIADSFFAFVACADEGDELKWRDPAVWLKANPMLGISKRIEFMVQQVGEIAALPSKLNAFLNKQLNLWTQTSQRWLAQDDWDAGTVPGLAEILKGKTCWGGLDLGRVHDLTSLALVFPPDGAPLDLRMADPADAIASHWKVLVWHWCPEDDIKRRSQVDRVPYLEWMEGGWIASTPGNATDFAFVRKDIAAILSDYAVQDIGFDRMLSAETVQNLSNDNVIMMEFGQGFLSMAGPTAELERLVLARQLLHDDNPLLAWEAGNVVTTSDPAGNIKPDKRKSREKIDGIVATIMALGRAKAALAIQEEVPMVGWVD